MKNKKKSFRKHFRINHSRESSGHPSYILRRTGDSYDSIGLTHSPVTDNKRNVRLRKNPNPKDNRTSYIRPFFRRDPIKRFSKRKIHGWKFAKRDKRKIRKYSRIRK